MNERIRELMGNTLDEKFAGTWSTMDMQDLTKFAERFAELLIRECAELMYGRDEDGNCKDGDVIKKHFGVEERDIPVISAETRALLIGIESSESFTIEGAKKAFGVEQ